MVEFPDNQSNEQRIVTDGFFEREVRLSREATATFLRDLADQIESGNDLTISSADWEIPFQYREPIEVEVEFIADDRRELEIELEFDWDDRDSGLSVE